MFAGIHRLIYSIYDCKHHDKLKTCLINHPLTIPDPFIFFWIPAYVNNLAFWSVLQQNGTVISYAKILLNSEKTKICDYELECLKKFMPSCNSGNICLEKSSNHIDITHREYGYLTNQKMVVTVDEECNYKNLTLILNFKDRDNKMSIFYQEFVKLH
ncbi:hypothetical protein RF11_14756 [Thelohanellus kitauei]|uniref:Uncharacterized protein n=1 Tax=Thelohanellus kitauei TaxID=669202 RepID=A0A0C2ILC6_THEKT|nr:hypothetical protein RF11_14756 [Thelohanellus kitauei]